MKTSRVFNSFEAAIKEAVPGDFISIPFHPNYKITSITSLEDSYKVGVMTGGKGDYFIVPKDNTSSL